jgi:hypothetical protein
MENDLAVCLVAGAAIGASILWAITAFPGEPIDYGRMADGSQVPDMIEYPSEGTRKAAAATGAPAQDTSEDNVDIDEEKIAQRLMQPAAQRMLGLSEEQIKKAVRDAKEEMKHPNRVQYSSYGRERTSLTRWFDSIVYITLIIVGSYFMYRDYGDRITPFLTRIFPREMSAFGFQSEL